MSFFDTTPSQLTGIQIKSWIDSLNSDIDSAKTHYDKIVGWLEVVEWNETYTQEDKLAVVAELENVILKIKSLLHTEKKVVVEHIEEVVEPIEEVVETTIITE